MNAWFMFDNHTFSRVNLNAKHTEIVRQVQSLFAKDGCGSLFVQDEFDAELKGLTRNGRQLIGGWGLPLKEIDEWVTKVLEERAFRRLMVA